MRNTRTPGSRSPSPRSPRRAPWWCRPPVPRSARRSPRSAPVTSACPRRGSTPPKFCGWWTPPRSGDDRHDVPEPGEPAKLRRSHRPRLRPVSPDPRELLHASTDDLMREAARLRDAGHGSRMTFSPKGFVPLTMLCRDRCGYCTFAKPPARLDHPYLDDDAVLAIARAGAAAGCHEALFTLGEAPEARSPAAAEWLDAHGYRSTVDHLVAVAG